MYPSICVWWWAVWGCNDAVRVDEVFFCYLREHGSDSQCRQYSVWDPGTFIHTCPSSTQTMLYFLIRVTKSSTCLWLIPCSWTRSLLRINSRLQISADTWKKYPVYVTAYSYFFGVVRMGSVLYSAATGKWEEFFPRELFVSRIFFCTDCCCCVVVEYAVCSLLPHHLD